jgi:ligand-binding SRPBCC domain-containing protein
VSGRVHVHLAVHRPTIHVHVRVRSIVAGSIAEVWAHASSMAGVNRELMPIVRMTYPATTASLAAADEVPLDRVLFVSWILLFGLIPIDRHSLRLRTLDPPHGFGEDSWSWTQRRWVHRRTLVPIDATHTEVDDEVEFEPRLGGARLLRPIYQWVFEHRHAVLRRLFGSS